MVLARFRRGLLGHFPEAVVQRARPGVGHYFMERSNRLGVGFRAPRGLETTSTTVHIRSIVNEENSKTKYDTARIRYHIGHINSSVYKCLIIFKKAGVKSVHLANRDRLECVVEWMSVHVAAAQCPENDLVIQGTRSVHLIQWPEHVISSNLRTGIDECTRSFSTVYTEVQAAYKRATRSDRVVTILDPPIP
ncbi:hypothetical protein TNCV_1869761 [Trichonephila clavipes]|nr:hypothetical protein TNCV_1869761 [Trichonephila clavipes]